eukprot:2865090-Amphidinium_carterae.1
MQALSHSDLYRDDVAEIQEQCELTFTCEVCGRSCKTKAGLETTYVWRIQHCMGVKLLWLNWL